MANLALAFSILGRDRGASKNLDKVGDAAQRTGKKFSGLQKIAAGGLVGGAVVKLFKDSVGAASDLGESLSKARVVFGSASADLEKFAQTSDKSLGLSKQAALEAAGTFGNLFSALGIGQKPAEQMSKKLLTLSADLASFNNANPADVLLALRSGLVGEAEPLRKFGVNISAARVEAEAFALGLAKPTKDRAKIVAAQVAVEKATANLAKTQKKHGKSSLESRDAASKLALASGKLNKALQGQKAQLSASQKAQATYSIILKDSKLAQGDFARTSGGLANSQRIMAASFVNAKAKLGEKLLPVMVKITRYITTDVIPAFTNLVGFIDDHSSLFKAVAGIAAAFYLIIKAQKAVLAFQSIFRTKMVAEAVLTRNAVGAASVGGIGGKGKGGPLAAGSRLLPGLGGAGLTLALSTSGDDGPGPNKKQMELALQKYAANDRNYKSGRLQAPKFDSGSDFDKTALRRGVEAAGGFQKFAAAVEAANRKAIVPGVAKAFTTAVVGKVVPQAKAQTKAALDTKSEVQRMVRNASSQTTQLQQVSSYLAQILGVTSNLGRPNITVNAYGAAASPEAHMRTVVYKYGRNGKAFA